jgi:hypothetical protein
VRFDTADRPTISRCRENRASDRPGTLTGSGRIGEATAVRTKSSERQEWGPRRGLVLIGSRLSTK